MTVKSEGPVVKDGKSLLTGIVGARLTSVDFVMDYLILGFDEKGALTTMMWPELYAGETTFQFGAEGYRDHLCELITPIVDSVEITAEETIAIVFTNGTRPRIPLRNGLQGEKAIFMAPKHAWHVWR
jgi:hypothetical protein